MSKNNTNLYTETESVLHAIGCNWHDITSIYCRMSDKGPSMIMIDPDDFVRVAKDTWYDNGFGCAEILEELTISGHYDSLSDFVMIRTDYDGAEGWDVIFIPRLCQRKHFSKLKKLKTLRDSIEAYEQFKDENLK